MCFFAAGGLFEGGLFDDAPDVPPVDSSVMRQAGVDSMSVAPPDSDDDDDHFGGAPSIGGNRYLQISVKFETDYKILKFNLCKLMTKCRV